MTITYDTIPCIVLSTDLKASIIWIENKAGHVPPFHQKMISQAEFQRCLKGKPQPKSDKDKAWYVTYNGKNVTKAMAYGLCVNEMKRLDGSGQFNNGTLKIAQ